MKVYNVQKYSLGFKSLPKGKNLKNIENQIKKDAIKIEDLNADERSAFEEIAANISAQMKKLHRKRMIDQFKAMQDARNAVLNI